MDQATRSKTIRLLSDWSRWMITINFATTTGCIIVLKTSDAAAIGKIGLFMFLAILCFLLSIVCSSLFVLIASIDHKGSHPRFTWLAKLQWVFFASGLLFVLAWIVKLSKVG